ncbi:MAG: hypothetical protein BWK73_06925 [Thiothrix lacustris]|uniref:DUF3368 domain-containing protein n=1 Tax=Thiothrix lacustris TaxID=525917 RepID=A0A1Y1QW87_9GAMM|nr:MAG: hypothetical protein BWK73_06925 [Thiothrix lacustris]
MIVIADSSPLVALSVCGCLSLLDRLFGQVRVPDAVFQEVCVAGKPEASNLSLYLQDKVLMASTANFPIHPLKGLGLGEREAMALYLEISADLLLVDDQRAKKVAYANGLEVMGSVGVLLLAKQRGMLPAIKPLLMTLSASDVHLGENIIIKALQQAGEL